MNDALLDRLDSMQAWVHRRRWWIRLASAVVCLPLIWSFVAGRWNAQPALSSSEFLQLQNFEPGLNVPPPEVDNTAALAKALMAVPAEPTLAVPTSAPEGYEWVWYRDLREKQEGMPSQRLFSGQPSSAWFDVTEALNGEWLPAGRHHLNEIVAYLDSPATRSALDAVVAEARRPYCLTNASGVGNPLAAIRQAAKMLAVRARLELAEHDDFEAALRDIDAILHLTEGMIDDGQLIRYLVALACRSLALHEVWKWPQEFSLTAEQLERLARLLDEHPCHARSEWTRAMRGELLYCHGVLDSMYTRSDDGKGFCVLVNTLHAQKAEALPRSFGAFNLLSPLFENRSAAESLLIFSQDWISRLAGLSPDELRRMDDEPRRWESRPALGGLWHSVGLPTSPGGSLYARSLILGLRTQLEGDLAAVVFAMSRYRVENGHYPEDLSSLVPQYLPQAPIDLFDGRPLRYRLDESGDYLLYSVDDDGQDDGGAQSTPSVEDRGDVVAIRQRSEPAQEWILVPQEAGGDDAEQQDD